MRAAAASCQAGCSVATSSLLCALLSVSARTDHKQFCPSAFTADPLIPLGPWSLHCLATRQGVGQCVAQQPIGADRVKLIDSCESHQKLTNSCFLSLEKCYLCIREHLFALVDVGVKSFIPSMSLHYTAAAHTSRPSHINRNMSTEEASDADLRDLLSEKVPEEIADRILVYHTQTYMCPSCMRHCTVPGNVYCVKCNAARPACCLTTSVLVEHGPRT